MPGRIPWATIQEWCDYNEIYGDERDLLDACFVAMDGIYLEHSAEEIRRKAKQK